LPGALWHTSDMGQKPADREDKEPSLELPSLKLPGFGRRKKSKEDAGSHVEAVTPDPPVEPEPTPAPEQVLAAHRSSTDPFSLPSIPGQLVAVVIGLVVGAAGALLTYLAMAGCERARGTSTCGGPGYFLLVAIVAVMVLLGALLLKAWQVSDPGSTSFLAVGLVAVVVLLTLTEVIFSAWMFVIAPVVGAASYALSHWVTTRFADEQRERTSAHDIR
jgi:hypothetical protein